MKIYSRQNRKWIKKIPGKLAEKAFVDSLLSILLALLLWGGLFYKYNILLNKSDLEIEEAFLKLKIDDYQEILAIWQEMQVNFDRADFKNYINPFLNSSSTALTR